MPRLTIDGRPVEVEAGATILDAARQLGIRIPTMCHVEGANSPFDVEGADASFRSTSCFLCVVQVDGKPNLVPACSAPAGDGMEVTTDSPDIRDARRTALELLLSDHVGDCLAPCTLGCPAGLDIPGFLAAVGAGRFRDAIATIKARIPFAGVLGRICPRFCERTCRRADVDEPIAVRALHRFAADQDLAAATRYVPGRRPSTDKRVAIVGAGPAGLSAAFYLLQQGHACTILDALDKPGGRFRYGVPAFRLPPDVLDAEIETVSALGAEFHMGVQLGSEKVSGTFCRNGPKGASHKRYLTPFPRVPPAHTLVALADLRNEFDAVLLAIGAHVPTGLDCDGGDLAMSGLALQEKVSGTFCRNGPEGASHKRYLTPFPGRVVVVGDGHIAIDVARTVVRLGAEEVVLAWPGRRAAARILSGRIAEAEAEGIEFRFETRPIRLERAGEEAFRLTLAGPEGARTVEAAAVVAATKSAVDRQLIEASGLSLGRTGIEADRRTLATNLEGVFAAGEAVSGPGFGVRAVSAGRRAALAIDQFLRGEPVTGEVRAVNVRMGRLSDRERERLLGGIEEEARVTVERIALQCHPTTFDEIEAPLATDAARAEAERCLQCACDKVATCLLRRHATEYGADPHAFDGARREFVRETTHPDVVFEPGKCIQCGRCVRIAEAARETFGLTFIGRGFKVRTAVPFDEPVAAGLREVARQCAEACPTGALALRNAQ